METGQTALELAKAALREELAAVEVRIADAEVQLSADRAQRTKLGQALRALDPEWAADNPPKSGPKTKQRPGKIDYSHAVSEDALRRTLDYLRANFDGKDFTAPELFRASRRELGMADSTIGRVAVTLHHRGLIQLVRRGGPGRGPSAKVYRLTEGGTNEPERQP